MSTVSVIIPTKNSDRILHRCLESIRKQTYECLEVIVVDDNSRDGTVKIAKQFDTRFYEIKGERTLAKNFGSKTAKGDFLLFLDSDMILEPSVIEECVKVMNATADAGGIIVPERSVGAGFWVKVRDFERTFYFGTKIESARFFRTRDVLRVGGFDEDIVTFEESTLPQKIEKIGFKTNVRISSFILHDEGAFNLRKWLKKKQYYSDTADLYIQRYKEYSKHQLGVTNRIYVYLQNGNWLKLLKKPNLSSGLFILKTLEFFYSKVK